MWSRQALLCASLPGARVGYKKLCTLLDVCVSSLRRGHANLLCIVPILTDDPRRESNDDDDDDADDDEHVDDDHDDNNE